MLPFGVYLIVVFFVDPFNYINRVPFSHDPEKTKIALEESPHLFKLVAFRNDPKSNLVLGDSRSNGIYPQFDNGSWSNLAYGGASLREIIDSYWFSVKYAQLDTVLIGVSLSQYSRFNKRFWVEETIERQSSFLAYTLNKHTFNATFRFLGKRLLPDDHSPSVDSQATEDFEAEKQYHWSKKLDEVDKFFSNLGYPSDYFEQLKEIAADCERRGTVLLFWVPPSHTDYRSKVLEYQVDEYEATFLEDLSSLGSVYHFDFPSTLTNDYENFRDPVHFTDPIARVLFEVLTGLKDHVGIYRLL
ncbi:hypothetical protein ADIS_3305 [Lunatimonas lonarensis]|uniref:DUF1574 domain-containing protein n=2 Tax=Lunatimonas lonarensis TaxID=1232681 RepID=R7ZQ11_9BACT|nr:hypothetical protein ADIS_3305 [Lunatimonas lonarensis]